MTSRACLAVAKRPPILALLCALAVAGLGAEDPASRRVLVICAPGSPGSTAEAQPTLDAFAAAVEKQAGWPASSLAAVYYGTAPEGKTRIRDVQTSFALVSPPFYYEYADSLSLEPRLEAVPLAGKGQDYSLVAKKGLLASAASLSGWEITGSAGFAERFVREVALSDWGKLPDDARITFSPLVLSALRKSASGEHLAVLLNREQAGALASLPFAAQLEVVHRSRELPAGIFCTIPARIAKQKGASIVRALGSLPESEAGKEALKSIRLSGFVPFDKARLPPRPGQGSR